MCTLRLEPGVQETIVEHALACYPRECCGVLLGSFEPWRVSQALRGRNVDQASDSRYTLDPRDISAAYQRAGLAGAEIVGFYHSHPEQQAQPSTDDRMHAWPGYLYLIISLRAGAPRELRAWRVDSATQAHELALEGAQPA